MATERVLSNLNLISFKTESGLQNHIDELQDGDLVFTPDNSLKGTLLDFKWADHILNDMSWLRADTFSWQSGDVYVAAYNHLVADFEGAELKRYYAWVADSGHIYYSDIENVTNGRVAYMYNNGKFTFDPYIYFNVSDGAVSVGVVNVTRDASKDKDGIVNSNDDTFGDTTITYYRAEDGHKICLPDQEDKVLELYNKTGVAWYYILDTENKQFKLPRSKHNKYASTLSVVGNGMALGITTGSLDRALGSATVHDSATVNALMVSNNDPEGVRVGDTVGVPNQGNSLGTGKAYGVSTIPEKSGLIAPQEQDTDQYKYLYFYVGCFEKEGLEQTAGITAEKFNEKADVDLSNINASQAAKDTISGWMVPDYSAGVDITWTNETKNITIPSGTVVSSQAYFIAPSDGMVVLHASVSNGAEIVFVNENIVESPSTNVWVNTRFPVSKGDEIRICIVSRYYNCQFFPFKGVN